jgi:hypothetical protein
MKFSMVIFSHRPLLQQATTWPQLKVAEELLSTASLLQQGRNLTDASCRIETLGSCCDIQKAVGARLLVSKEAESRARVAIRKVIHVRATGGPMSTSSAVQQASDTFQPGALEGHDQDELSLFVYCGGRISNRNRINSSGKSTFHTTSGSQVQPTCLQA